MITGEKKKKTITVIKKIKKNSLSNGTKEMVKSNGTTSSPDSAFGSGSDQLDGSNDQSEQNSSGSVHDEDIVGKGNKEGITGHNEENVNAETESILGSIISKIISNDDAKDDDDYLTF